MANYAAWRARQLGGGDSLAPGVQRNPMGKRMGMKGKMPMKGEKSLRSPESMKRMMKAMPNIKRKKKFIGKRKHVKEKDYYVPGSERFEGVKRHRAEASPNEVNRGLA